MLPNLIDSLYQVLVLLGKRNNTENLREVSVAGRADQQPARLTARFLGERAQPGSRTVAKAEGLPFHLGGVAHRPLCLALAPYPYLREVAAGAALINVQLTPA